MYTTIKFLIQISEILMEKCIPTEYFDYTLYTDSNYKGKTGIIHGSTTDCMKIKIDGSGDNKMKSYKHNSGRAYIRLYAFDSCSGSSFTGISSNTNIGSPCNDNIRSYRGCDPIPKTTRSTTTKRPTTTTRPTTITTQPTTTTTRPTTTTTRLTTTTTRQTTTTTRPTTTRTRLPTTTTRAETTTTRPTTNCPPFQPPQNGTTLSPIPTCPTPSLSTTSKATTIESGPSVPFICSEVGSWADTMECSVYHVCELYDENLLDHIMNWPSALVFCNDTKIFDCNYKCDI